MTTSPALFNSYSQLRGPETRRDLLRRNAVSKFGPILINQAEAPQQRKRRGAVTNPEMYFRAATIKHKIPADN